MRCKICGKYQSPEDYSNKEELESNQLCFECNFWHQHIEKDKKREPHTWFIANGGHYIIEPDRDENYQGFVGFGGAEFKIKFNDGTLVVSHNVWFQGEIPEAFRRNNFYRDNATIIK